MRKLKLAMYVSADGVVENPAWTGPYWSEELSKLQGDYLFASDALLLGRVTYDGFAKAWPTMEGTGEFGEKMNSMPKFVASRTLDRGKWNAAIIKGDLPTEVAKLEGQSGDDLLIYGSGDLVDELTRHGLIDEYRLMIHPVIVGSGKRLFADGLPATNLHLADSTITKTGVVVLTYTRAEPAQNPSAAPACGNDPRAPDMNVRLGPGEAAPVRRPLWLWPLERRVCLPRVGRLLPGARAVAPGKF